MKLHYDSNRDMVSGVCPKCKSWIEFYVSAENMRAKHTVVCMDCGETYRDIYIDPLEGDALPIPEMVNHPAHYQSETGLEVIDVMEAFTFDLTGIEAVNTSQVLKYICRWKKKNGVQDLKKAKWYLDRLIKHVEKLEEENKTHD